MMRESISAKSMFVTSSKQGSIKREKGLASNRFSAPILLVFAITAQILAYQIADCVPTGLSINDLKQNTSRHNLNSAASSLDYSSTYPLQTYEVSGKPSELALDMNYLNDPLLTAASHHHKKGVKGWLDMGAWTKKKGAFGWYADYPVGKG